MFRFVFFSFLTREIETLSELFGTVWCSTENRVLGTLSLGTPIGENRQRQLLGIPLKSKVEIPFVRTWACSMEMDSLFESKKGGRFFIPRRGIIEIRLRNLKRTFLRYVTYILQVRTKGTFVIGVNTFHFLSLSLLCQRSSNYRFSSSMNI